jgi:alpha-mannosidase
VGVPRVDFELRVDWREVGSRETGIPHLKVRFPLDLSSSEARYEIPFGAIRRDLFDGEEVPAQRWVDLSERDGQGVTLVNTSKYGFSVEGSTLNMTLLRSSIDPDPLPDQGEHVIRYALVPHGIDWGDGESTRVGEDLNVPLVVSSSDFHTGDLPAVHSLVSVQPANVRLAALKKAEDGQGFVLRLVEVEGANTDAQVHFAPDLVDDGASAVEVDTLERPLEADGAQLASNRLTVHVPAYGILTVKVTDR